MIKIGVLWKIRYLEHEIAIAEESGPVRTFRCLPTILDKMMKDEIRQGSYIEALFDMEQRQIVSVELILLEGHVCKWAMNYAFVHAPVIPQVKLGRNNRVQECKFINHPPKELASTYLNPLECSFTLENNMAIRFGLCVNLKKMTNLRNPPFLDVKAVKAQKVEASDSRRSSQSSQAISDSESKISGWLDRRMSSPRPGSVMSPSGRRNPDGKLDEGFRKRGGSTPVKKHVKRDPSHLKRPPITHSAPVTPVKEVLNVPETKALIKIQPNKYRPYSATKELEAPPLRIGWTCLRCEKDGVNCTHKPPHPRKQMSKPDEQDLQYFLNHEQEENARLRKELETLRLQMKLSQKNSQSNVQNTFTSRQRPVMNVPYDRTINYDNFFDRSPSVSPSSSPRSGQNSFEDPEKFLPFLSCGGKPSSTRSDILASSSRGESIPLSHHHYGTPMTHTLNYVDGDFDFLNEEYVSARNAGQSSATTNPRWATNSEQITAREYMDYFERRRSPPRELSETIHVPPMAHPKKDNSGADARHIPSLHDPPTNHLKPVAHGRWTNARENGAQPSQRPYYGTPSGRGFPKSHLSQRTQPSLNKLTFQL